MTKRFDPISADTEGVAKVVVDAAFKVHSTLGPGLLESVYKACLLQELSIRGLEVRSEVPVPVVYEGLKLDAGYRIDILVNGIAIIEIKAVDGLHPIHIVAGPYLL